MTEPTPGRIRAFWGIGFAVVGILAAQTPSKPRSASQQYLELARMVYTWEGDPESSERTHLGPKEESKLVDRLHELVQDQIRDAIRSNDSSARPSVDAANVLRERIERTQAVSLATWGRTEVTNTPFATPFHFNGHAGYAVAYTVMQGASAIPDSHAFLEFFARDSGGEKVVEAPTEGFRGCTFFLYQVPTQVAGEERILVWGNRIGDTGVRLAAKLYAFDGRKVKVLWQRDELIAGDLNIKDGMVLLQYDPYYHARESERITERLYFTPTGLQ